MDLLQLGCELRSSSSWSGLFMIFIKTGLQYTAHENISNLETCVLFEISIEATEGGLRLALAPTYLFFAYIGYRIEADKTCS
jgi:hypothetical protein